MRVCGTRVGGELGVDTAEDEVEGDEPRHRRLLIYIYIYIYIYIHTHTHTHTYWEG